MLASALFNVSITIGLMLLLATAFEYGYRRGNRAMASPSSNSTQLGAIQGAVLGLLALLLAFAFAGASTRFTERQDLITKEASAIATAYVRADLIPEPHATALRVAMKEYVAHRLVQTKEVIEGRADQYQLHVDAAAQHERIWRAARDGVLARPESTISVVDAVSAVFDVHTEREYAPLKRLPGAILVLLLLASMLAMAVIGYGSGLSGPRALLLNFALGLLMTAALWMTIDLDNPRSGWILLSDAPLEDLKLGN